MIKSIIFDIGGTLINTYIDFEEGLNIIYNHLIDKSITKEEFMAYSFKITNELYKNRGLKEIKFNFYLNNILNHFNTKLDINDDEAEVMFAFSFDYSLMDNVIDLLKLYKKEYKLYVLSNSTFSKKCIERLLDKFNILSYFEDITVSSEYGLRKPSKELFNIAIDKTNNDIKEIVFIGDSYDNDIIGAMNVGMKAIYFNSFNNTYNKNKNVYDVKSYKELLGVDICKIF